MKPRPVTSSRVNVMYSQLVKLFDVDLQTDPFIYVLINDTMGKYFGLPISKECGYFQSMMSLPFINIHC